MLFVLRSLVVLVRVSVDVWRSDGITLLLACIKWRLASRYTIGLDGMIYQEVLSVIGVLI